jgi:hypothetical protein
MRTVLILPLALAAAVAAGGCGTASDGTEQTAFRVPQRDLTLQPAGAPDVEVASPVELARRPVQPSSAIHHPQHARRPVRAPRRKAAEPAAAPAAPPPASARTLVDPLSLATGKAPEAADPHALAPGRTVTVIPASSGPSSAPSAPEWTDQRPGEPDRGTTIHGGGDGGGCGHGGTRGHPGGGGFRSSE